MPILVNTQYKTWLALGVATVLSAVSAGCSETAIQNAPPYSCKVIPGNAFDLTTDPEDRNDPLEVGVKKGDFTSDYYSCVVEKGGSRFGYQQWRGDQAAEGRHAMESWDKFDAEDVPAGMGMGWIGRPIGTGWVHWSCDNQPVLSRISAPDKRDRDVQQDILQLLEIAQQRYAELNDCEIRPPE